LPLLAVCDVSQARSFLARGRLTYCRRKQRQELSGKLANGCYDSDPVLLLQGVNPKVVQEGLGHSSINLTLDTYSHVIPSLQKDTATKANEMFQSVGV